jgi:hypothetical protein
MSYVLHKLIMKLILFFFHQLTKKINLTLILDSLSNIEQVLEKSIILLFGTSNKN